MTPPIIEPGARRRRRWPYWLGGFLLVAAGAAAAIYFTFIKAPEDVSHPEVEFTAPKKAPNRKGSGSERTLDWPLYGYNRGRTRYLPGVRLRPPYRRLWTRPGSHLIEFQPVLSSRSLYYQKNNGEVYAVRASTGRVRWRRRLGRLSASSPAAAGGKVYAVSNRGGHGGIAGAGPATVYALSSKTGRIRWGTRLGSASESSPLATEGRIYLGSHDGTIYALSAKTGRVLWRQRAPGSVKAALAFSQGRLYAATYGGNVLALRAKSGRVLWRAGTSGRSFGRAGNFYGTPAVAFGRVYATNTDGRVYSFAASSGRLAWSHTIGGYVYAAPAVADVDGLPPAVFTGSYSGHFVALDARSGRQLWSRGIGGTISGAPSVIGGIVYVSTLSRRRTYGLSAKTGRVLWGIGRGAFNPAISDGKRLYITGYSSVYAFEPKSAFRKRALEKKRKRAALKRQREARKKKRGRRKT